MNPYFINIHTPHEALHSEGFVKNKFDVVLEQELSNLNSYNDLYNKYKTFGEVIPITISSNKAVSSISIPAINEKYMFRQKNEFIDGDHPAFKSSLNILYLSSKPDMEELKETSLKDLSSSIVSNLCGMFKGTNPTYTKHNLLLNLSQFTFFGITEDLLTEKLKSECNDYYSYDNVKGEKLKKTLKFIENKFGDEPVHIVFDLELLSQSISPLSFRYDYALTYSKMLKGINMDELMLILDTFKKLKVVGLDITNYNLIEDTTSIVNRIQSETIQRIYGKILNIKEKSFNVFNENSKFLIFKPLEETELETESDIGWYILRGVDINLREQIMMKIDQGQIITVEIPETETETEIEIEIKEILVTTTTIFDQNEFSYYSADHFLDKRLYPDEKIDMMFELINS